jgi:hypothetical protein
MPSRGYLWFAGIAAPESIVTSDGQRTLGFTASLEAWVLVERNLPVAFENSATEFVYFPAASQVESVSLIRDIEPLPYPDLVGEVLERTTPIAATLERAEPALLYVDGGAHLALTWTYSACQTFFSVLASRRTYVAGLQPRGTQLRLELEERGTY